MYPLQHSWVQRIMPRSVMAVVISSVMVASIGLAGCQNDEAGPTDGSAATVPGGQLATQSSDVTQPENGAAAATAAPQGQEQQGQSPQGTAAPAEASNESGDGASSGDGAAATTPITAGTQAPNNFVYDLTKDGFGLTVTEVGPDTHFVLRNAQGDTVYDKTYNNADPELANIIVFPEGAEGDPTQGEVVFKDDAGNEITRFPLVDVLQAKENSAANG